MTRKRIPCTLSSRVIGPSSHSGSLGRVVTLGKIGPMAFFFVHGKCQHYYESGHSRPATSVLAFVRAFGGRWFVYMSGPLTVPFTAAAVFVESSWLKTLFAVLAVTCVLFSCYWVWRHERQQII